LDCADSVPDKRKIEETKQDPDLARRVSKNKPERSNKVARKIVILQTATIPADIKTPGVDVSDGNKIEIQEKVDTAGSAGTFVIEHSNVDVDSYYVALGSIKNLNSAVVSFESFDHVMQYIRVKTVSAAGNPVLSVNVLVK
jgi:hypothetical protein